MSSLALCVVCILLTGVVGPAVGQADIFFIPPGIPCTSPNATQAAEDSTSVMFVEDSTRLFPFQVEGSGRDLCVGPSTVNRTEVLFTGYTLVGDDVGFDNIAAEHLGNGMIRWIIDESDPAMVVQVLRQFYFISSTMTDAISDNPQRNVTVTVYLNDVNSTASTVTVTIFLVSRNDPPVLSLGDGNDVLTVREDVDTGQPISIIQEPQLLELSDEESNDHTHIEVSLFSPNGDLDANEYIVLMNDGTFSLSMLSATSTTINYTETAQFDNSPYFSYKIHKDFLRKVFYYAEADEPSFFNTAGDSLVRQISITVTDSLGVSGITVINIVIEPVNDHRPILRFLNATPGCFRLGPSSDDSPVAPPAAARGSHNATLVEQIRTNVWSAYNNTSDFLATHRAVVITPSVLVALFAAVGTVLAVLLCCCRCRRGSEGQHRSKVAKRARKYLSGAGGEGQLPVVQGKRERGADVKRRANNSTSPRMASAVAQGGTPTAPGDNPPPLGNYPMKGGVPKDPPKQKKREPITLASLAAKKADLVTSDSGETAEEEPPTMSVEKAPGDDRKRGKGLLRAERIESTDGSLLPQASGTGKAKAKLSESGTKSQRKRAERKRAVEVLSPRRVVNATDVRGSSVVREGEGEEEEGEAREEREAGKDAFGDLPQKVSPQRRSGDGLSHAGPRQYRNVSDASTAVNHKKTDVVQ